MSEGLVWTVILVLGIGTFLLRFSFIQLVGRINLPEPVTRALRFVPPAVLSAIILPALLQDHATDGLNFSPANPYLLAGIVAALTAWITRSMVMPLATGLATLYLLQWWMG